MNRCLWCGKETKRPKFCCNKHKDRWHNTHNPRGYYEHLNVPLEKESKEEIEYMAPTEWDHGEQGYLGEDGQYG